MKGEKTDETQQTHGLARRPLRSAVIRCLSPSGRTPPRCGTAATRRPPAFSPCASIAGAASGRRAAPGAASTRAPGRWRRRARRCRPASRSGSPGSRRAGRCASTYRSTTCPAWSSPCRIHSLRQTNFPSPWATGTCIRVDALQERALPGRRLQVNPAVLVLPASRCAPGWRAGRPRPAGTSSPAFSSTWKPLQMPRISFSCVAELAQGVGQEVLHCRARTLPAATSSP